MTVLHRYNRWGEWQNVVKNVFSAIHSDCLDGSDTLELTLGDETISKGDRLVWEDVCGKWHEQIVTSITSQRSGCALIHKVLCISSIFELDDRFTWGRTYTNIAASSALSRVISEWSNRWSVGVAEPSPYTGTFRTYRCSNYEELKKVLEIFGGEIEVVIKPGTQSVDIATRQINLLNYRGNQTARRFELGKNMVSLSRKIEADEVITRLYGFGKGEASGDGFTNRITISDNPELCYIADEDARLKWGTYNKQHRDGVVIFDDCEDRTQLKNLTTEKLKSLSKPIVTYEATFEKDDYKQTEPLSVGDALLIVDDILDEKISARVYKVNRNLLDDKASTYEISNTKRTISDVIFEIRKQSSPK